MSDDKLEDKINEMGLNAPKVTLSKIDSVIRGCHYFTAMEGVVGHGEMLGKPLEKSVIADKTPLNLLTFCVLVLENGFTVVGKSACASPENFNSEVGRQVALNNAKSQIWELEGYLLKQRLHNEDK